MKKICSLEGLWGSDSTHYARVSLCLLRQEHLSEGPGEPPGGGNPSTKPSQTREARFWTGCGFPSLSLGTCSSLLGPGRTLPPADRAVPSHPGIAWQRAPPGEQTAGGLPHCIQTPAPFSLAHFSLGKGAAEASTVRNGWQVRGSIAKRTPVCLLALPPSLSAPAQERHLQLGPLHPF